MSSIVNDNYLKALISAGANAQKNLFAVEFTFQTNSPVSKELNEENARALLTVRSPSFTMPDLSTSKYENKFLTAKVPRPAAKVSVTRHFDLTFRVDSNYKLYSALLKQQNVTFNAAQSYAATDILTLSNEHKLFDVRVTTVPVGITKPEFPLGKDDPNSLLVGHFKDCWIKQIDPLSFSQDASTPISIKVTCNFLEMFDYQTQLVTGVVL